ncbi:putative leucine-rich repeat-containing protein DDB_G0290503 isoform X2 [Prorops nasuta]|uniref:putative leucine-rich repeat-containing protein DDB_G0290503 isoform X2 n=1 Tax=Prorops nasuta TaxID=863751 RepID=UPI0034CF2E3F
MTGWQVDPSFAQQHQHHHELTRIISQLATANQQLATAHASALTHLESLYLELAKERDSRKRFEELSKVLQRLSDADRTIGENEEDLVERKDCKDNPQLELREFQREGIKDETEELENFRQRLEAEAEETKNENGRHKFRLAKLEEILERQDSSRSRYSSDEEERRIRRRVERLDSVVKTTEYNNDNTHTLTDSCETINSKVEESAVNVPEKVINLVDASCFVPHEIQSEASLTTVDDSLSEANRQMTAEILRLSREIERLKADRLGYENLNKKLINDLEDQKNMIKKLNFDYEISQGNCEKIESSLNEREKQYDELSRDLNKAKKEVERLLEELNAYHLESDTAQARISSLEKDLEKSQLEKEKILSNESETSSKLRAQLSEEVTNKSKQSRALNDALIEIQRLKETMKTESKDDDSIVKINEDVEIADVASSAEALLGDASSSRVNNLEEFKKELSLKREARQKAIAAVSSEMERLRRELDAERDAHLKTTRELEHYRSVPKSSSRINPDCKNLGTDDEGQNEDEEELKRLEAQRLTSILKVSDELRNDIRFQIEKIDDLRYKLESEPDSNKQRIEYLAKVTSKAREGLYSRERCSNQLKDQLAQILVRLKNKSLLNVKDDVKSECERQLENINNLKNLYNERLKILSELRESTVKELVDVKEKLEHSLKKSEGLEEELKKAEGKIDVQDTEISSLESQLGLTKADCRDLQNQMSLINSLFTQMLLGASSADMDLDKLTRLLQENHELISEMAREEGTEAAALPKLLLDLVEQVEGKKAVQNNNEEVTEESESDRKDDDIQGEDIANNLPKVWRVLMELLSCHAAGTPSPSVASSSDPNSCYKSVDTPAGPRLVISVSKTYIRLKELILEKKHLEKEMNRMKQLNFHLESKLGEQEKRLSMVSVELSKTWNIVGRMQAQHQQLHTHEQILRYELQQKRKMLQELKQELEYCREKWESARQKNTNTEIEWRSLRREFAARKALAVRDSFNNSGESGFSDERGDDTDEDDEEVDGRLRIEKRKRTRKEGLRAPSPDTESEQPTDTELSESKINSEVSKERTCTPETDIELDEMEVDLDASENSSELEKEVNQNEELDPLDRALTNVIENLIRMDGKPELENQENISQKDTDNLESTDKTDAAPELASDGLSASDNTGAKCISVFGAASNYSASASSSAENHIVMEDIVRDQPVRIENRESDSISIDSSSSLETVKEFSLRITESIGTTACPGSSAAKESEVESSASSSLDCKASESNIKAVSRTHEDVLAARADRLKRLEEQANWLMKKMNATSLRGSALSTRLEELHEAYGEPPTPPPMPDVLPARRLQTNLSDFSFQLSESASERQNEEEESRKMD